MIGKEQATLPVGLSIGACQFNRGSRAFAAGFYNPCMRSPLLLCLILAPAGLWAQISSQTAPQNAPAGRELLQKSEQPEGRRNQKIERIRHEDAGSTIDEVRYGGQTQSITVQPKANVPEYEIAPTDLSRSRPADHRDGMGSATGQRLWNVFKF